MVGVDIGGSLQILTEKPNNSARCVSGSIRVCQLSCSRTSAIARPDARAYGSCEFSKVDASDGFVPDDHTPKMRRDCVPAALIKFRSRESRDCGGGAGQRAD